MGLPRIILASMVIVGISIGSRSTTSHAQDLTPILPSAIPATPERTPEADPAQPTAAPMQPTAASPATTPTSTALPAANTLPDRCEPNADRSSACALVEDTVNGPYTFLPDGDQDWYRLELADAGLETVITVRGTAGLDLRTTISRDDGTPLADFSSPVISATLTADITGGVLVRVEKRDPESAQGQSYVVEVRHSLPPPPAPTAAVDAAILPDLLEDNWNGATAAPIAVGVVYELNFVCPVRWGCPGGDHDYLRLPVKAGLRYLIATFDLGPGSDTVLDLFWGDEAQPLAINDDARTGASFLSVLRWVAPADGEALIRIGPRTGGIAPLIPAEEQARGTYRFAVALADSDLATQIEQRIAEQTNAPKPTAAPPPAPVPSRAAPAPAPAAPAPQPTAVSVSSDAPKGLAVVRVEATALREGPGERAPLIQNLPAESAVTLLGQSSGAWVRVQPVDGVIPGWVRGVDLALVPAADATAHARAPTNPAPATLGSTTPAASPTPATGPITLRVEPLDSAPPPQPTPPVQRLPVAVTVRLVVVAEPAQVGPGQARPTPAPDAGRPLAGQRVQLINAFGDLLAEAVTPSDGEIALTSEVDPGTAVFIQLPAIGLRVAVDAAQPLLVLTIPEVTNDDLNP